MEIRIKDALIIFNTLVILTSCEPNSDIEYELVERDPLNTYVNSYLYKLKVTNGSELCPARGVRIFILFEAIFILEDGEKTTRFSQASESFGRLDVGETKTKSFDLVDAGQFAPDSAFSSFKVTKFKIDFVEASIEEEYSYFAAIIPCTNSL